MDKDKHAFLISVFQFPDYVEKLINMLDGDRSNIYLHINKRNHEDFRTLVENVRKKKNVFVVPSIKVNWGGKSLLDSLKIMLTEAYRDNKNQYFHFISGQDLLCKPIDNLYAFFDANPDLNYLKYYDDEKLNEDRFFKDSLEERIALYHTYDLLEYRSLFINKIIEKTFVRFQKMFGIKRNNPESKIVYGEGWFSLNRRAISILLQAMENEEYYAKWNYSFATEEMFTHTVLYPHFKELNVINSSLRYAYWDQERKKFPAILDESYYDDIITSGNLFCRKIHPDISAKLLEKF